MAPYFKIVTLLLLFWPLIAIYRLNLDLEVMVLKMQHLINGISRVMGFTDYETTYFKQHPAIIISNLLHLNESDPIINQTAKNIVESFYRLELILPFPITLSDYAPVMYEYEKPFIKKAVKLINVNKKNRVGGNVFPIGNIFPRQCKPLPLAMLALGLP